MKDELAELDLMLKELFMSSKFEEMQEILQDKPKEMIKELTDYSWGIIKKYYDMENYAMLLSHYKFVAYSCFLVEYIYKLGMLGNEVFEIMMSVYQDIYDANQKQSL